MPKSKCNSCKENKEISEFPKGRLTKCKKCHKESEAIRRSKMDNTPVIYLIWLGEEGVYYVGSTICYQARKSKWIGLIQGTANDPKKLEANIMLMRRVYQETKFCSMKKVFKCETYKEMIEKERELIVTILRKHKDVYNVLC